MFDQPQAGIRSRNTEKDEESQYSPEIMPSVFFHGAIVEDTGIGASGILHANSPDQSIPEQIHIGNYGALTVDHCGGWRYILHEMESEPLGLNEGMHASDTISVQLIEKCGMVRSFGLQLEVWGTDDIPDIRSAKVVEAATQACLQESNAREERGAAENPIQNMIEAYLGYTI
jgi:VCBS repeat-containing protein